MSELGTRAFVTSANSTVTGNKFVAMSHRPWGLAYRTWRKNALMELVISTFDKRHNLVGRIELSDRKVSPHVRRMHLDTWEKECDRFEYVWTEEDVL